MKVKFVYRGTNLAGQWLADLLEDMSVEYTIAGANPNAYSTFVSSDLGALLQTLDERVITKPKQPTPTGSTPYARAYAWLRLRGFDPHHSGNGGVDNPAADNLTMALSKEFFKDTPPTIQTAVPPAHVRDRNVLQWLRGMNIPIGVPITLQFVDDLTSKGTAVTERL